MKANMLQSDDVTVPNIRVRKFHIDPQIFEKFFYSGDFYGL